MNKLTAKQEQSCHDFIETGNKTEAYRRNYSTKGMSESTLNTEAVKHFNIPKVSQRVKELQKRVEKDNQVSQDKVIGELANISFFDIRELFDENGDFLQPHKLSKKAGHAISSIKVTENESESGYKKQIEYKLNDKGGAIDKLSKIMGYYEADNKQSKSDTVVKGEEITITIKE